MRIREVEIADDMIRLGQFLKLAGLAEHGAHARELVEEGEVTVNGRPESRRGAQLKNGDVVAVDGEKARLVARTTQAGADAGADAAVDTDAG
ncbi:RNA-binding S4 domain-containing protein [Actinosynnema pretiosum]|uniref:RNA-binding protein n=1 Tax=Actinosynnema pretiosum TaxID=42197 RepID=A0A290Z2X7_9PSEU|nr:RNA-binding S4 domain-containing protein [Actinosynnema pretiosum]ATE53344.1 RNA-binding protein [Actinosynnema pretiosum]